MVCADDQIVNIQQRSALESGEALEANRKAGWFSINECQHDMSGGAFRKFVR